MDRVYQSHAIETPPSTVASSGSYPTAGSKASGQLATVPGPYWFYSITEEIRNAIIAAGLTPDSSQVNQLAEALAKFLPLSGGTMTSTTAMSRNVSTSYLSLLGGTAEFDGAQLDLCGKGHSSLPGYFLLHARSGSNNSCYLEGRPDGTLTWGGKGVERDVAHSFSSENGGVSGIRLASGLQICWGQGGTATGGTTYTFPFAFSQIPAGLAMAHYKTRSAGVTNRTTTSITVDCDVANAFVMWIAFGQWK